jgi:O-glycosyl hydrolase
LIDQAGMTLFLAEFVGNCNWEAANANPGASLTNWTYFDNVYSGPNFQQLWGMMAYLNQRGITNGVMPKFTGPTALWMGGESLTPGYENAYAEMLASAVIYARKTQNLQFTVVSPLNEPDTTYTGVHLSGASQYVTVVDDLGQQLDANGMSDVRFSGPDLAYTTTSWMTAMMGDPYLMSKVAHFGLHGYQGLSSDATGVSSFLQHSAYPNTHFWMTEFSVWCESCQTTGGDDSWANAEGIASFLLDLLAEGASAGLVYEAWDGEWINYNASTGQDTAATWDFWGLFAVDDINAVNKTYTPRKQFYTVSQITKYVAPGAIRIGVSGASTPLTLLAFYNTNNGQFTLTGVNSNSSASSLSCALTSLPAIPSLALYYTSSTTNLCYGGSVAVNNGAFSVVVPASCVFTLTYTNTVAGLAVPLAASQAPYFLAPFEQNGSISLTLVGASGRACLVEASSDLVNWSEVTNVTLLDGTATISQPMTAGAHFYRATLLP